ncbi:MAG: hypothetical protein EXS05_00475 [Planctomycetaceae bacterium]|nr:hypothetical protein [Planctomycetaceae bacterium]
MWRRWFTCLSFVGLVFIGFGTVPCLKADDASNDSGKAAAGVDDAAPLAKEDPLSTSQEMISRRYKRFEDTLYKIAESMRKTDPDRADLLLRAIGKSKEDRIGAQMSELVQLLRDNKQLGDAIERQGDVVAQLHTLLDLLLSEDRAQELKEKQARIKKYLAELNNIIAKEKGNRADNERGAATDDVAAQQKKIADQTGKLGKTIDKDDQAQQAKAGKSKAGDEGKPGEKGSKSGDPKAGDPDKEKSGEGKSPEGDPKEADPKEGKPGEGKPGEGDSKEGDPKESNPGEGKPSEGKPSEGKPSEGDPGEGDPQEGQPSEGKPGEGQPSDSQPGKNKPQDDQQTPGRDELQKAKRAMEQAIEKLKQKQRHEASDEQDEAIANLQKAKEKLEEILRQLREEERERFLAMLEARFQRMLAMQLLVYDGTQKLARTSEGDRSPRHSTRSLQLAREEDLIAIEATKAITLLRDEGTAVAFPEAVEQVRDDMRIVESRLERTEVGELTQSIEREIIDALEEMIEALQKEMEKSKEQKDNPPPKDSQPQDPALVDQLAELKMLRTLQLRVNHRTKRLGQMVEGEQALENDLVGQLQNLSARQARIQKATHDIATGKNK